MIQENGVTLLLVAIVSIKNLFNGSFVKFMLYAFNLTIYISDIVFATNNHHIQVIVNRLNLWAKETGFKFSERKTVVMHFCKKRSCETLNIDMNGTILQQSNTHGFLGMKIDHKWLWTAHINNLKTHCKKSMNALKCLKRIHKSSNRQTLLQVLRSLIISKLDYGCEFYETAAKSHLKKLETIKLINRSETQNCIIITDSASTVHSVFNPKTKNPYLSEKYNKN